MPLEVENVAVTREEGEGREQWRTVDKGKQRETVEGFDISSMDAMSRMSYPTLLLLNLAAPRIEPSPEDVATMSVDQHDRTISWMDKCEDEGNVTTLNSILSNSSSSWAIQLQRTIGQSTLHGRCPQLPIEVWEQVLSYVGVYNDPWYPDFRSPDLARCALVCRAWVPRCRFELYTNPVLGGSGQNQSFFRTIKPFGNKKKRSRFDIHMSLVISDSHDTRFRTSGFHLIPQILLQHPQYAASIKVLSLAGPFGIEDRQPVDFRCPPAFLMSCRKSFTSVTTLRLWRLGLSSSSFLARFILSFPALQTLDMSELVISKPDECSVKVPKGRTLRLRELKMSALDKDMAILRWFRKHSVLLELQTLTLGILRDEYGKRDTTRVTQTVQNVLHQASSSLQHVELDTTVEIEDGTTIDHISGIWFTRNVHLASVRLKIHSTAQMDHVIQMIILCRQIETIDLDFWTGSPQDVFDNLDNVASKLSASLKYVKLRCPVRAEWVVRGSSARRSKKRASIAEEAGKRSAKLLRELGMRGGDLLFVLQEYWSELEDIPTSDEDEFSDTEDDLSEWPEKTIVCGVVYKKIDSADRAQAEEASMAHISGNKSGGRFTFFR